MNLTLSGLKWRATSPSRFELIEHTRAFIVYDGAAWRFDFDDGLGLSFEAFETRSQAAQAIADGINAFLTEQRA